MDTERISVSFRVVSSLFRDDYLPKYATTGSAGMDLHACVDSTVHVPPGDRVKVPTGIAIQLPSPSVVALVYARSGLAWKQGLALANGVGVIDSDYVGELQILLMNFGDKAATIEPGDRIAQLVLAPIYLADWARAESLTPTERGSGGFGSTGVHN
jgi:dUTP pyrophosphatase